MTEVSRHWFLPDETNFLVLVAVTPYEYKSMKRSEWRSILPVYAVGGFIAWTMIHGSFTSEILNKFISIRILLICSLYLGSRSIIIR